MEHGQPTIKTRSGLEGVNIESEVLVVSFGKMNKFADIKAITTKDSEGFATTSQTILVSVRVYREGRHGSEKWANLAAFSEATDLFRFRAIPGVLVTTEHYIECERELFDITSVENVKGRGMYTEVLAKKVVSSVGKS
ncbi:hypothetical protein SDC9_190749 [bioreactor metagenome]|uniref:Uncharacterized protein n=1 Tax=bioreactor metagenome TaxID=1076179 RepID=A0A645HWE6_9ZZZZ